MKIINIQEAKTHLSRLVEEALVGEGVVIAKSGKPLVQLVPVGGAGAPRPLGLLAGQVTESADCWEPDEEVTSWFYPVQDEPPALSVAEDSPARD